jgi:hypothetical protein
MGELTAAMDNVLAWRLGEIARAAGSPTREDVGDPIDRGLVLLRLLNLAGFSLTLDAEKPPAAGEAAGECRLGDP